MKIIDCHKCLEDAALDSAKEINWCLQKPSTGTYVLPTGLFHACVLNNSVSVVSSSIETNIKLILSANLSPSSSSRSTDF